MILDDGAPTRDRRETDFELILSLGLPTRVSWLDFTVKAIFLPFEADSTPELEFETNFVWLPAQRTRGWLSSHFDVVDKFSPAERPSDRRAYTHKLNFEVDTSVAVVDWLPDRQWLHGVELEGSLDYVATRVALQITLFVTALPHRVDPAPAEANVDRLLWDRLPARPHFVDPDPDLVLLVVVHAEPPIEGEGALEGETRTATMSCAMYSPK
jgi:hypothetical protein